MLLPFSRQPEGFSATALNDSAIRISWTPETREPVSLTDHYQINVTYVTFLRWFLWRWLSFQLKQLSWRHTQRSNWHGENCGKSDWNDIYIFYVHLSFSQSCLLCWCWLSRQSLLPTKHKSPHGMLHIIELLRCYISVLRCKTHTWYNFWGK